MIAVRIAICRPQVLDWLMAHERTPAVRAVRSLLLLLVVVGLQVSPAAPAPDASAPSQPRLAAAFLLPAVPLPVSAVDGDRENGEGRNEPRASTVAADASRLATGGRAHSGAFCPWRARDALERAGRTSSPPTGPPPSPV